MYTRNVLIKILKVKNVILYILGVAVIMGTLYANISNIIFGDFNLGYIMATVVLVVLGLLFICMCKLSDKWIGDANMISAYFEGDLDGQIPMSDMAKLMSMSVANVTFKLRVFRCFYMKGYSVVKHGSDRQVVLDSRKIMCQCKECGGEMERSGRFVGKCGYCGGLDISTKVLYEDKFYSIENDISKGYGNPKFYQAPKLNRKMIWAFIIWGIGAAFALISLAGFTDLFTQYRNDGYDKEALDTAMGFAVMFIGFLIPIINGTKRLVYVFVTLSSSTYFAKRKTPYVEFSSIPFVKSGFNKRNRIRILKKTMRKRYLNNCNFEIHNNELKLVLSKRIDKNKCPYCGSAITVPVNEHYECTNCNRKIMYLVKSK